MVPLGENDRLSPMAMKEGPSVLVVQYKSFHTHFPSSLILSNLHIISLSTTAESIPKPV